MEELNLNVSQKRYIRASLLSFERALRWIYQLLTSEEEGILFHRDVRLDAEDRKQILCKIDKAFTIIKETARRFNLEVFEENIEREILAEMSISWENLEECRSKRVKGYGDLSSNAAELIDKTITELVEINLDLLETAEKDIKRNRRKK
ncbi:hypothetical protein C4573_00975 [Candidatus Woesearchaeota archaeon]|jgi:vacuolar-type H+-ATPase subunit H|nr:MAG: hypothetical protein C4573_00975 [Candidatus Woesearchaeota archaeon]